MGVFLSRIKVLLLLYMNELCLNYPPYPPHPLVTKKITRHVRFLSVVLPAHLRHCILWINDGTVQGCISRTAIHISDALMVCS